MNFLIWQNEAYLFYFLIYLLLNTMISNEVSETRGGSRAAVTSTMERFVIIVNGSQPLTIIIKHSNLDVTAALDPPLEIKSEN